MKWTLVLFAFVAVAMSRVDSGGSGGYAKRAVAVNVGARANSAIAAAARSGGSTTVTITHHPKYGKPWTQVYNINKFGMAIHHKSYNPVTKKWYIKYSQQKVHPWHDGGRWVHVNGKWKKVHGAQYAAQSLQAWKKMHKWFAKNYRWLTWSLRKHWHRVNSAAWRRWHRKWLQRRASLLFHLRRLKEKFGKNCRSASDSAHCQWMAQMIAQLEALTRRSWAQNHGFNIGGGSDSSQQQQQQTSGNAQPVVNGGGVVGTAGGAVQYVGKRPITVHVHLPSSVFSQVSPATTATATTSTVHTVTSVMHHRCTTRRLRRCVRRCRRFQSQTSRRNCARTCVGRHHRRCLRKVWSRLTRKRCSARKLRRCTHRCRRHTDVNRRRRCARRCIGRHHKRCVSKLWRLLRAQSSHSVIVTHHRVRTGSSLVHHTVHHHIRVNALSHMTVRGCEGKRRRWIRRLQRKRWSTSCGRKCRRHIRRAIRRLRAVDCGQCAHGLNPFADVNRLDASTQEKVVQNEGNSSINRIGSAASGLSVSLTAVLATVVLAALMM